MAERKTGTKAGKNPLQGAAVIKALLTRQGAPSGDAENELYRGVLRDLGNTDEEVEAYLRQHSAEVEQALRAHGRRGS